MKYVVLATLAMGTFLAGCNTLEKIESSPVAKEVFNIALRSVAYQAGIQNPNSIDNMVEVASIFVNVSEYLSPESLDQVVDEKISGMDLDQMQKANVKSLARIVKMYYSDLHSEFTGSFSESDAVQVLRNMGEALIFGLQPSVDGANQFVLERDSLIIVVD